MQQWKNKKQTLVKLQSNNLSKHEILFSVTNLPLKQRDATSTSHNPYTSEAKNRKLHWTELLMIKFHLFSYIEPILVFLFYFFFFPSMYILAIVFWKSSK